MEVISYYIKFKLKEIWFMKNHAKNDNKTHRTFENQDIPSYALNDTDTLQTHSL